MSSASIRSANPLAATVYALEGDVLDHSRWVVVEPRPEVFCLHLSDLCASGRVSSLDSVCFPRALLGELIHGGTLQVADERGYALLSTQGGLIRIEFKGSEDSFVTRSVVRAADLAHGLGVEI